MQKHDENGVRKGVALIVAGLCAVAVAAYGITTRDYATAWLIGVPIVALGIAADRTPAHVINGKWASLTSRIRRH